MTTKSLKSNYFYNETDYGYIRFMDKYLTKTLRIVRGAKHRKNFGMTQASLQILEEDLEKQMFVLNMVRSFIKGSYEFEELYKKIKRSRLLGEIVGLREVLVDNKTYKNNDDFSMYKINYFLNKNGSYNADSNNSEAVCFAIHLLYMYNNKSEYRMRVQLYELMKWIENGKLYSKEFFLGDIRWMSPC